MSVDHNRLIAQEAKGILLPLGMAQKGRSRLWLDDHAWWVGVVEFQPSAWSKGSYLNVAATWLWYPKDSFSFDYGPEGKDSRVESFHEFRDVESFSKEVRHLAEAAAAAIEKLRRELPTVEAAAHRLRASRPRSIWSHYHAAVAGGLVGDIKTAEQHFGAVLDEAHDFPWVLALKERAKQLRSALRDKALLTTEINSIVRTSRTSLKLKPLKTNAIEI